MRIQLAVVLCLAARTAAAEDEPDRVIGVDAAAVLPLSDYGEAATLGFGALGRLVWPIGPVDLTARAGVLIHVGAPSGTSLTLFPIYGGAQLPLDAGRTYFVEAELGPTIVSKG